MQLGTKYAFVGLLLTPVWAVGYGYANELPVLSQSQYDSCMNMLKSNFASRGIAAATFDYHRPTRPDPTVIRSLNHQPEFRRDVWDYLSTLVDEERVLDGVLAKRRHLDVLYQVENRYGVDMHHVLGVWGVESNFGQTLGRRPLFESLATLSCFDRRQAYFRGELMNALRIVQNGDIAAQDLTGSWAGAFGQTQFMPSTFLELAVDFDGDGRRDIVNSVPDALASTANFLSKRGYRQGEPWGFEVKKPSGAVVSSARKTKKPISYWRNLGYTLTDGRPLPNTLSSAGLLAPAGSNGPIFLVGRNFDTFYAYNQSESYALAIAHLSDLIKAQKQEVSFFTAWPTDDMGVSRRQSRQIQQALINLGYDIGAVDGIIGDGTRRAIQDYQHRHGLLADGRAGQKLYQHLMGGQGVSAVYAHYVNQPIYQPVSSAYDTPKSVVNTQPSNWGQARQGFDGDIVISTDGLTHYRVVTNPSGEQILIPIPPR